MRRRTDSYLAKRLREFERRCLIRILRRVEGDMSNAARIAGRDRSSFYGLLKRHEIDYRSFRRRRPRLTQHPPAETSPVAKPADRAVAERAREWFGISVAADR